MVLRERWRPLWLIGLALLWTNGASLVGGKPQGRTHTSPLASEEEANEELISEIHNVEIKCATNEMNVKIPTPHSNFNGMVYPQVCIIFINIITKNS